jgi:hypothetical protein
MFRFSHTKINLKPFFEKNISNLNCQQNILEGTNVKCFLSVNISTHRTSL